MQQVHAFFRSGERMRSRSVSDTVLAGALDVPAPPARLVADWLRDVEQMGLAPGDVETLSLPRTRARWPALQQCVQAMADWTAAIGLPGVLASSDMALMACRGARYHHDGSQYGSAAFCNLFLSDDKGLDVHFAATSDRIPLARGTVLMFDTAQPHAVIDRARAGFDASDFPAGRDCTQVFLTWELPIEQVAVARALRIAFDVDPATCLRLDEEQVRVNGEPGQVCPASGRWRPVG